MVKIYDMAVVSIFIISSFPHGREEEKARNKPVE